MISFLLFGFYQLWNDPLKTVLGFALYNGALLSFAFFILYFLQQKKKELVGKKYLLLLEQENERLKLELNKRYLMPHTVLNSMMSIVSWVSQDTTAAISLINNLADEFREINILKDQSLIPFEKEIAICRKHLNIMACRKEICYTLMVEGEYFNLQTPPLIIYSLVENALKHAWGPHECGTFRLQINCNRNYINLRLTNNVGHSFDSASSEETGFSYKYVRSRLKHAFGDNWSLVHAFEDPLYIVAIQFPCNSELS